MNKAVLISIKPEWCTLISRKEKTLEVRKSRPKIDTPFKCYIYCSKSGVSIYGDGKSYVTDSDNLLNKSAKEGFETTSGFSKWNGKVIGEFMCDWITGVKCDNAAQAAYNRKHDTCISDEEIMKYANNGKLYYWHISDLKIYDRPKELREFRVPCAEYERDNPRCGNCRYYYSESNEAIGFYDECRCDGLKYIERPPQSWCYVEECEDNA